MRDLLLFVANTLLQLIVGLVWIFFAAVLLRAFYDALGKKAAGIMRSVKLRDINFAKPATPFRDPRDGIIAERDRTIAQKDRELAKLKEGYARLKLAFRYRGCELTNLRVARDARLSGAALCHVFLVSLAAYAGVYASWRTRPNPPMMTHEDSTSLMDAGLTDAELPPSDVNTFDHVAGTHEPIKLIVIIGLATLEPFSDFKIVLTPDRRGAPFVEKYAVPQTIQ